MITAFAPIRVLIAEDHALVRAGLRRLLDDMVDVEVVGEASDGRDALDLVLTHDPDVVLMDVTMPNLNGLSAVTRVVAEHPRTRVLMLSMHNNEEYVWQALRAGAAGYLLKDGSPSELGLAIRAVAAGGSYLAPAVSRHVVDVYVHRVQPEATMLARLTPRQVEILQLICEGHTNHQIASTLGISLKTVETHRAQVMLALGVHDVTALVRYAVRAGLVSTDG